MQEQIKQLIEISRKYGSDKRFVIAGGGNTSYKDTKYLWVKASGHALANITEEGFAILDRRKLQAISTKNYTQDVVQREEDVKNDLYAACTTKDRRPSVETSLHEIIFYSFVVHLHPTVVNGLMCSRNAQSETYKMFGDNALFIPYTDPGFTLFKVVDAYITHYKKKKHKHPNLIFLQNHGIFVGADTIEEIESIYDYVIRTIEEHITIPCCETVAPKETEETARISYQAVSNDYVLDILQTLPAIRMMLSRKSELKTLKIRTNNLTLKFASSFTEYTKIDVPFMPDVIVYCKSNYIYLTEQNNERLLIEAKSKIVSYMKYHDYAPKVLIIKGIGIVAVGNNAAECDIILDMYEDMMKVTEIAQSFGGYHSLNRKRINFIDNWEVENYRRKVSAGTASGRVLNKTIIVTGGAQGFGEGIAACLLKEGANIVIADLNETAGKATVERLRGQCQNNRVIFVNTNVADTQSLQNLMYETIFNFGGLDVFISNAGVLRAGEMDDFTEDTFEFVTKINYNAYFYCTQAASRIMKLQNEYARDNYCDIIQINSKSGLRGSKANFAYAGSKFGGLGLTQSFALELAPYRIKVNAVCPGNFYEGPLWSNPENGLFKQYLKAKKAPGAKTINDVRNYYLKQVPMHKGTNPDDVTKAILYLIDQTCETGQALPVTGGQVMIN